MSMARGKRLRVLIAAVALGFSVYLLAVFADSGAMKRDTYVDPVQFIPTSERAFRRVPLQNEMTEAVSQFQRVNNKRKYYKHVEPVHHRDNMYQDLNEISTTTARPLYIPQQRIVHFDLKGAPPKVSYFKSLLPVLKTAGATGILMEWEDTFPFSGPLKYLAKSNHYSKADVREMMNAAKKNGFTVIPLVQTFGHLEFALKLEQYRQLREVDSDPRAICPTRNETQRFIHEMIDQVVSLSPGIKHLHIGCDEVYSIGICDLCREKNSNDIFLSHVSEVAKYVRAKHGLTPIIWDDMLHRLSAEQLLKYNLGELVEPMVWVYVDDIYRFVSMYVWDMYTQVFQTAWTASAYKGAFGETLYVANIRRHVDNNLSWLQVMAEQAPRFKKGLQGIVHTGWQRYDHFAILCEILPVAVPSAVATLLTTKYGFFNQSLTKIMERTLLCLERRKYQEEDPALASYSMCSFPGVEVYRVAQRLEETERDAKRFLNDMETERGFLTSYNRRHGYSSPERVKELMMDFYRHEHSIQRLVEQAEPALKEVFDDYTTYEWIEQRLYPVAKDLQSIKQDYETIVNKSVFERRPLPILQDLASIGVKFNSSQADKSITEHHYAEHNGQYYNTG